MAALRAPTPHHDVRVSMLPSATVPGLEAMTFSSMDENIETAISFFREEIDQLTHDDEMTLMEIIEQASRKKQKQKEDSDGTRSRRHSTVRLKGQTPPLAPRNGRAEAPRNSPSRPARTRARSHNESDGPAPSRRTTDSSSAVPGVPYSADESSTGAVMGDSEMAKAQYYDYGPRTVDASDASDASSDGLGDDLEGPYPSGSPMRSPRRPTAGASPHDNHSTDTRRTGHQSPQPTPNTSRSQRGSDRTQRTSGSDHESLANKSIRADPYGELSTRNSFAVNEGRESHTQRTSAGRLDATPRHHLAELDDRSHVSHRSEPKGRYVKPSPCTPNKHLSRTLFSPDEKVMRGTPDNHGNKARQTKSMPKATAHQPVDPPNSVAEPSPRMSRPAVTNTIQPETPRPSKSEVEAWKSMVQVLRETLDRQEQHIQKLERENDLLRSENEKLRQETLTALDRRGREGNNHHHQNSSQEVADRCTDEILEHPSIDALERDLDGMNVDDSSVRSEEWSLPHQLFIRRSSPHVRTQSGSKVGKLRSQLTSRPAFSPPAPEMDRFDRPPSPHRMRYAYDGYGAPMDEVGRYPSSEQSYFTPIPKYAFSPGTKVVGDLSGLMNVQPEYAVPLSYMVDEYYGRRRSGKEVRDARSEMRARPYR